MSVRVLGKGLPGPSGGVGRMVGHYEEVTARITNYGISTFLAAAMREYEDLKMQSVFLLVHEDVKRAEVLAQRLGESPISANHVLEEFADQGLVKLSGAVGRYRTVAWNESGLRRLAATLS